MVFPRVPFRRRLAAALVLAGTALSALAPAPASAAVTLTQIASGLNRPVFVTHATPTDTRLFIVEQPGVVRVKVGSSAPTVFLNILSKVRRDANERGLFSVAFHPDFASTDTSRYGRNKFYVNYTDANGSIAIEEYRTSSPTASSASAATARRLMTIPHPTYDNHNGGQLAFGPDRYLYISTGDGGGAGDPGENAQDKNSLLGKILRIGVQPLNGQRYWIPSSNPFYGSSRPGRGEIWSYGLRNPWRFSFDFARNDMWIGDVGQAEWEEVDVARSDPTTRRNAGRGTNYGWDIFEGKSCFEGPCGTTGTRFPAIVFGTHQYGCAVTGGYVARRAGQTHTGRYFFADYCGGQIFSTSSASPTSGYRMELNTSLNISSFGEDNIGRLYLTDLNGGVYRISGT
jgi:glucose/arabinose dehydrogenase